MTALAAAPVGTTGYIQATGTPSNVHVVGQATPFWLTLGASRDNVSVLCSSASANVELDIGWSDDNGAQVQTVAFGNTVGIGMGKLATTQFG